MLTINFCTNNEHLPFFSVGPIKKSVSLIKEISLSYNKKIIHSVSVKTNY